MQTNLAVDEADPLVKRDQHHGHYTAYPSRWYIIIIFFLFCVLQNACWGFYSPIQQPVEQLYGWTDSFVEWLGNTGNITFTVLVIPFGALVSGDGMRRPLLFCVFMLCLNTGLRCIPVPWVGQKVYDGISMLSMVCNGFAGTVEALSPPVLAALWFPVRDRATATAIMASANTCGTAVGFSVAFLVPSSGTNDHISTALTKVYWGFFLVCVAIFGAMIVYFPTKPPTPPAPSCEVEKVALAPGIKKLILHRRFWIVVFSMAVPLGVYAAWLNALDINLKHFKFSQTDAGWVGFSSALAGTVAGILSGRVADKLPGHLARLIALCYVFASGGMIWFTLICFEVLPYSLVQVYIAASLTGFAMYATYPLFFELVIETTFPIPEACSSAFLVMTQAFVQAIFLALPVNEVGTKWMNFSLMICPGVAAVLLALFREDYRRLTMDLKEGEE